MYKLLVICISFALSIQFCTACPNKNNPTDTEKLTYLIDLNFSINQEYEFDLQHECKTRTQARKNKKAHCGFFAIFLAEKLTETGYKWIVYDLKADLLIHSVVEVYNQDGKFLITLDPSLGYAYRNSIKEIQLLGHAPKFPISLIGSKKIPSILLNFDLNNMSRKKIQILRIYQDLKDFVS